MIFNIDGLFSGHGFGINTNILETNVINLAVVIAIVISFGGDALRNLLSDRKQKILDNIASAEARVKEIEDKMAAATTKLSQAEQKASEIRQSSWETIEKEKEACVQRGEKEAQRYHNLKDDTIRFEHKKAISAVSKQLITLSVDLATEKVEQRMESDSFHQWVNNHKMTFYNTIKDYSRMLV